MANSSRHWLVFGCFIILFAGSAVAAESARRNIIFFLADDLGYMDIGANNRHTFYETPNIDRLAKAGMRFTNGYAACPVCSPTRGSIMTGKYPPRFGITDFIGGTRKGKLNPAPYAHQLALDEVTIAKALREGGYTNFFAGKWHLGEGEYSPNGHGFGPGLQGRAGFYYPDGPADFNDPRDPKTTDRIANAAVQFIEANRDRPFFAYLSFPAVHIPIGAKPELVEKYERKKNSAPADAWGQEHANKVRLVQNNPVYAGMLEQLDSAIGRVMETVARLGLTEQTVFVFMSDNGGLSTAEGYVTSNAPLRGGKGWLYEGGIREPWIMSVPGLTKPGSVCDTPVISTDFYPTLLELAGLPLRPMQHRDGVSLVPLLKGKRLKSRDLFWHYPHYSNQGGGPAGAVRQGDWKLIEWYEDGSRELYNLRTDPGEQNNLATLEPARTRKLAQHLDAWRKEVKAVMPSPRSETR